MLNTKESWRHGAEKTEAQSMINIIHSMAGQMAVNNVGGWHLSKAATFSDYVFTEWSNGIIDVGAETFKIGGEPSSHDYYIRPSVKDVDDE